MSPAYPFYSLAKAVNDRSFYAARLRRIGRLVNKAVNAQDFGIALYKIEQILNEKPRHE